MAISYPYNATSAPVQQPAAHGDHPHLGGGGGRRSIEESLAVHRCRSPAPPGDTRMLSSHYVEEMVEKVLQEQQLYEKFNPTVLIAVCDDSIAPARMLCHHLRYACAAFLSTRLLRSAGSLQQQQHMPRLEHRVCTPHAAAPPAVADASSSPVVWQHKIFSIGFACQCVPPTSRARSGQSIPVLTSKLDLYDESNPYNPLVGSWATTP